MPGEENTTSGCAEEVHVGQLEEFLYRKDDSTLECVTRGGRGVTIPGGVQGKTGRDIQCQCLVPMVVFSHGLDSMTSGLFQPDPSSCLVVCIQLEPWGHRAEHTSWNA